jgi:hypothetical protein
VTNCAKRWNSSALTASRDTPAVSRGLPSRQCQPLPRIAHARDDPEESGLIYEGVRNVVGDGEHLVACAGLERPTGNSHVHGGKLPPSLEVLSILYTARLDGGVAITYGNLATVEQSPDHLCRRTCDPLTPSHMEISPLFVNIPSLHLSCLRRPSASGSIRRLPELFAVPVAVAFSAPGRVAGARSLARHSRCTDPRRSQAHPRRLGRHLPPYPKPLPPWGCGSSAGEPEGRWVQLRRAPSTGRSDG